MQSAKQARILLASADMTLPLLLMLLGQFVAPGYLIYILWRARDESRGAWLLRATYSGAFVLYIFLVGAWHWTSYYSRFLMVLLFAFAAIASYRRVGGHPWRAERGAGQRANLVGGGMALLLFLALLFFTFAGHRYSGEPVRLALPLRDGDFYVAQGGNSSLINCHHSHRAQRFALDVVQLNALGIRARGLYPSELDRYVIFGAPVYSPCDGTIVEAVDDLPDHVPPDTDQEQPAGNHLIIDCLGVRVALAHPQRGTVQGTTGMAVSTGQRLASVGNSGNTSEPHLHMHAVRNERPDAPGGEGVPIVIDGTFAVRNTVFRK